MRNEGIFAENIKKIGTCVKTGDKRFFFSRTELMVWDIGPTKPTNLNYSVLAIEKNCKRKANMCLLNVLWLY